ncbi:MAG: hypothetical protein ACXV8O_04985 [Methylobacter sp.]
MTKLSIMVNGFIRMIDIAAPHIAANDQFAFTGDNATPDKQTSQQQIEIEFVVKSGALFKRMADDSFWGTPFCPLCRRQMWSFQSSSPYECLSCGHNTDFPCSELNSVIAGL